MSYQDFLQRQIFENSVQDILIAVGIFVGIFIILRFCVSSIVRKLQKAVEKTKTHVDDAVVAMIRDIGVIVYGVIALFVSAQYLVLPPMVTAILKAAFAIVIVYEIIRVLHAFLLLLIKNYWLKDGEAAEHMSSILGLFYRLVRCLQGQVTIEAFFDPQLNYARSPTTIKTRLYGLIAFGNKDIVCLRTTCPFRETERGARSVCSLSAGEDHTFICTYGSMEHKPLPAALESLAQTKNYWETWVHDCQKGACPFMGTWNNEAVRSSLVLKILAGGHGIAAAATTSLPEVLGGQDNWDYRFSWIRDTSFTIQALTSMGHMEDAREFLDWLCITLCSGDVKPADLKMLYPLHGETLPPEEELTHFTGYEHSRPVRIGNAAAGQHQIDIYGEILETIFRSEHLHPGAEHVINTMLQKIVDHVCDIWQEPDDGIWELRTGPQHYVYSKVMCWVALDRGIRLAEEHKWHADITRWKKERDNIHSAILERGYSEKRKCFVQAFDSERIDATALLFPLLEFLSPNHPYAQNTLETIQRELANGALVYRSDEHHGKEGAFGLCSFWLVDALAIAGHLEKAIENFLELLQCANHVGLYAEEIDPKTNAFLGNFPQAFTHVGLINSAAYLGRSQVTAPSPQPLMGEVHMPGGEQHKKQ